ncbi:hypothetical protein As57867_004406, partial [Aphanomyces stellatus]
MRVQPTVGLLPSTPQQPTPPHGRHRIMGLLYLGGSLLSSSVYLLQLHPSVANDFWWPGFNTSGTQTFLSDVVNAELVLTPNGTLPLLSGLYRMKSYASPTTTIEWSASYGRQLLLEPISLVDAITAIRFNSFDMNQNPCPAYCWLDLNRTFEMAHTAKRQSRCTNVELHNGAVYMELVIRNSPYGCLTTSTWASAIESTILAPLRRIPKGHDWLVAYDQRTIFTISDEVVYWSSHGIQYWLNNMQNLYHDGIDDSIHIQNALGYTQSIGTKKVSLSLRGVGSWSTLLANIGVFNDLVSCQYLGCSLIRQANNSVDALGLSWVDDILVPGVSPGITLVQQVIGPFTAIDIKWVVKPSSLLRFVQLWRAQLYQTLTTQTGFEGTVATVDPVPMHWMQGGTQFYGGNPMCPYGTPQPYVQPSFGYYDDCGSQIPHTIDLSGFSILFSMLWMPSSVSVPNICAMCDTTVRACTQALLQSQRFKPTGNILAPASMTTLVQDAVALNICFMQMATRNGIDFVLTQPLIDARYNDPWTFYGWVMIYDWLVGAREVYRFDGDESSVTLMSQTAPTVTMAANPLELPQHACTYIWYITVYVTFVLCGVGVLALLYALVVKLDFDGRNLFQVNRVVGSTWIGRPVLFLRSMTALIVLSTSSVEFTNRNGFAALLLAPRSFWLSALFAGEATWLNYIIQDILLPLAKGTSKYSFVSPLVTWIALVSWDQSAPIEASATAQSNCTISYLGLIVGCESGLVSIGSWPRLVNLMWLCLGLSVVPFCFAQFHRWFRGVRDARIESPSYVSAAAKAYFVSSGDLDSVASVMAGLLCVSDVQFDIKLWQHFEKVRNGPMNTGPSLPRPQLPIPDESRFRRVVRVGIMLLGFMYMIATLVGSYTFLNLTQDTMANDFWWEGFNSTDHQTFLASWFNTQLQTTNSLAATQLDNSQYSDPLQLYINKTATIDVRPLYAAHIQSESNTLTAVVAG